MKFKSEVQGEYDDGVRWTAVVTIDADNWVEAYEMIADLFVDYKLMTLPEEVE